MRDDDAMTDTEELEAPEREESPEAQPYALARLHDRRVIAGVASGLADYWNVSPAIVRIGFIALAPFGGLGILLYVAGWLIIPDDGESESIADEALRKARSGESWVGVAFLTLAAVIAFSSISGIDGSIAWAVTLGVIGYLLYRGDRRADTGGVETGNVANTKTVAESKRLHPTARTRVARADRPPRQPRPPREPRQPRPPRPRRERSILGRVTLAAGFLTMGGMVLADNSGMYVEPRHYVAALLTVVASGLIVGAFVGRARWLVVVGVILLPFAFAASWTDGFTWSLDAEEVRLVPMTVDDLDSSYSFEAVDGVIDLRNLTGETFDLNVDVGAGDLDVYLPTSGTGSSIDIDMGVGDLTIFHDPSESDISIDVGIGDIDLGNFDRGGFDVEYQETSDGAQQDQVTVDLGIGQVSVRQLEVTP